MPYGGAAGLDGAGAGAVAPDGEFAQAGASDGNGYYSNAVAHQDVKPSQVAPEPY